MTKAELIEKLKKMSGTQLRLFFGMGEFEGVPDEKVRSMALAFFGMNMMLDPATVPHRSSKPLMLGCKMHNRAKDAANAECTSCGASRGVICAEYEESTEAAKPGSAIKRVGTPAIGLASALSPHEPVDWQPIHTVPKDGTRVLVVCMSPDHEFEKLRGFMAVEAWDKDLNGFGSFNRTYYPATHWRYTPELPA